LHLLREHIGDPAFWADIAGYTTSNFGKSVTTDDLRRAMEQASKRNLESFFSTWVYQKR
jgi:aminopeptidase N